MLQLLFMNKVLVDDFLLQIRGMHTIIRDATSSKNDFVFYADRLNRLIIEAGLGHLPFKEKIVKTPTGVQYCYLAPSPMLGSVRLPTPLMVNSARHWSMACPSIQDAWGGCIIKR